jgi:CRISPR/Cas system-associated protein Cas5 (RAMP superfamily)
MRVPVSPQTTIVGMLYKISRRGKGYGDKEARV